MFEDGKCSPVHFFFSQGLDSGDKVLHHAPIFSKSKHAHTPNLRIPPHMTVKPLLQVRVHCSLSKFNSDSIMPPVLSFLNHLPCSFCHEWFKTQRSHTKHIRTRHGNGNIITQAGASTVPISLASTCKNSIGPHEDDNDAEDNDLDIESIDNNAANLLYVGQLDRHTPGCEKDKLSSKVTLISPVSDFIRLFSGCIFHISSLCSVFG